jgi:hypothetical protein
MSSQDLLRFRFDGGIAEKGQMDFYEASRFQYGCARLLYTIEHFRQTGHVKSRITGKSNVDLRSVPVQKGSFIQDVVILAAPLVGDAGLAGVLSKIPLKPLVMFFVDQLMPKKKAEETALGIVKEITEQGRQRTLQSVEETKRLQIVSEVALQNAANTNQALEIIKMQADGLIKSNQMSHDLSRSLMQDLQARSAREEIISKYKPILNKVDPALIKSVADQISSPFQDIFVPLRTSADSFTVTNGSAEERLLYADDQTISGLFGENIDSVPTELLGKIVLYNIETGHGSFRNQHLGRPISFRVSGPSKNEYRDHILEAMKFDEVSATFYGVKDHRGKLVRLIFDKLIDY